VQILKKQERLPNRDVVRLEGAGKSKKKGKTATQGRSELIKKNNKKNSMKMLVMKGAAAGWGGEESLGRKPGR